MSSATSTISVSINSTSGKLTLNATGQTIDLDASILDFDGLTVDIDATTVNLDATTINSNFTDNNIIGNTNITGNLNLNAGSNRYTFPTNRPASAYMLNGDGNGTLNFVDPAHTINDSLSDPNTSLTIGKDLTVGRNLKTVGIGTIKNLTFSTSSIV